MQVNLEDAEYRAAQKAAAAKHLTMADYVRVLLREDGRKISIADPGKKLAVLRKAPQLDLPASDIETMLAEIERGYIED